MCQRPNGSLLRAWCVFLFLLLAALIGAKVWPEGNGIDSSESTKPESSTTSAKWDALQSALGTLKGESSALVTDSDAQLSELQALQTEHAESKSSFLALLKLWENSEDLRKAEKGAAERERQALLDRALRAERHTRILGGVTIGVTAVGAIGWILWAVK